MIVNVKTLENYFKSPVHSQFDSKRYNILTTRIVESVLFYVGTTNIYHYSFGCSLQRNLVTMVYSRKIVAESMSIFLTT